MNNIPFAGSAMALLLACPLLQAEIPTGNLWPNATFEEGTDLDLPTGTPAGWSRGGNDGAICQVTSLNAVSGTHSLIVVDTGGGYGEWYHPSPLPDGVAPGDSLALQWYEMFTIAAGNEERVTILFFNAANSVVLEKHFVQHGNSAGWAGSIAASPFVKRNEILVVPAAATHMQVSLVSGGPASGQGTMLIDDFSIVNQPKPKLLAGNIWPNPSFELGTGLGLPTGLLTGWNRGGSETTICQVSSKSTSPSHGLAVVDASGGYGEWYSDLALAGQAAPGDSLDLQWFEVFDIPAGSEERVSILFFNATDGVASEKHFLAHGQSAGWAGSLGASPFVQRNERVLVPAGAVKMRVSVVSGGPAEGQGTLVIDDFSAAPVPKPIAGLLAGNFWPNPTFEEGTDLGDPAIGKPTPWNRGGSDVTLCTLPTANSVSASHSLGLEDANTGGYGEWYADYPLSGLVRAGSLVNLQWFEAYHIDFGEMRLTAVFLDAQGNGIGDRHFVVKNDSSGWSGDIATSTFSQRNESIALPAGTMKLRLSFVSGGPSETTGIYFIDNVSAALAPSAPVTLFGNFWPNPGFELGDNLDDATGTPAGWNRGGSDGLVCQVTHANYNSSTHALAVIDNGTGYGEWYSDFPLGTKAKPGDTLGLQWFELFNVGANGEMRLSALFFNAANAVVAEHHFVAKGNSTGWAGTLVDSSFSKRNENLLVPAGASRLRISLVSGGPGETTGTMVVDDLSVAPPPVAPVVLDGNFWPNPGFEEGAQLDNPASGQPTGWSRGGSDVSFDQVSTVNWKSTDHSLFLLDTSVDSYGEWYRSQDLQPLALAPDGVLQAQWFWAYDTVGDMRLTFLFFAADDTKLGQRDYVIKDQSPGWTGSLASSPLVRRVARLVVPEGTTRLFTTMASGGASSVTGTLLLDDLSMRVAPPGADTDRDGVSDDNELLAGTDPEDSTSFLHLTSLSDQPDGRHIVWSSVPGRNYAIEFAGEITGVFTALPGAESLPAADPDTTTSYIDARANAPASGYYRVRVLAN